MHNEYENTTRDENAFKNDPWFLTREETPTPVHTLRDTLFAWLSILVCFLTVRMTPFATNTLGAVIAVCLLFVFLTVYFKSFHVKVNRKSLCFAALILCFTVGFLTCANEGMHRWLFLWIVFLFLYWIYTVFQLNDNTVLGEELIAHFTQAAFVIPVKYCRWIFPSLIAKSEHGVGNKITKTALWILLGLGCAVIPTTIVIAFLSYDAQFRSLLNHIFSFDAEKIFEFLGDVILAFLFALVLFGSLFGGKSRFAEKETNEEKLPQFSLQVLPRALICAAVTPVLIVYVLFFISQWDYYISAFTKVLPEALTYADYAREGFFQLCWVCGINAVLLLLFHLLMKRTERPKDYLRTVYSILISLFTLILIATALSKMLLYIDSYGLTRKRVYASWMILLLAVWFVIVLIRPFVKKLPMIRLLTTSFVVFFAFIAILNVDSMIASYNVRAYLNGNLPTVDVDVIAEYEASAVPALTELLETLQEKEILTEDESVLLDQANDALWSLREEWRSTEHGVLTFNFPTQRAKRLLENAELYIPVSE